jgi:pyruvate kinase
MKINAKAVVCLSTTGKTAQLISSFRPKMPILAVTHHMDPLNRLELMWGIQNFRVRPYRSSEEVMKEVEEILLKLKLAATGDKVVITMGTPVSQGAKTNTVRVYTITGSSREFDDQDLPLRYRQDPSI